MVYLLKTLNLVGWICFALLAFKWKPIGIKIDRALETVSPLGRWFVLPVGSLLVGAGAFLAMYLYVYLYKLYIPSGFDSVASHILYVLIPSFLFIATASAIAPSKKGVICLVSTAAVFCFWASVVTWVGLQSSEPVETGYRVMVYVVMGFFSLAAGLLARKSIADRRVPPA